MAHNLNLREDGTFSFFSVKESAWHGLGQIVSEYPTSAEAMKFAGLDYEVIKLPNTQILPSGKTVQSENSYFTFRSDTEAILGDRLSANYTIIQNRDAFAFFDAIVGGGEGIMYETAGALGNGERIFITAKLPGYIRVGNGDDVTEKYLFLTTSHDGTGAITAAFTPVRIVCQNTLNAALRHMENVIRIKHTGSANERLKHAHRVMGIANTMADELEGIFNQWSTTRITDAEVMRLIRLAMCPNKETLEFLKKNDEDSLSTLFKNQCNDVFTYAMMSDTQKMETTKGTVFGAYNAVTGYFQNVRKYKTDEDKVNSILFTGGTAMTKGQAAFDLCSDYVKHGAAVLQLS